MRVTVTLLELVAANENARTLVDMIPELKAYSSDIDWLKQPSFTMHFPEKDLHVSWDGQRLDITVDLAAELAKQHKAIKIIAPLVRAFMALKPLWESTIEQLKDIYRD